MTTPTEPRRDPHWLRNAASQASRNLRQPVTRRMNLGLFILSVVALIMAGLSEWQINRNSACQSAVNEAVVQAQNYRGAAADEDRQSDRAESAAFAELIRAIFASKTQADVATAYAAYNRTITDVAARRAQAEAQRAAHPIPAPPSQTCG